MAIAVHIVIVTHNSARELPLCLEHLVRQSLPISSLVIVDSGSDDPRYLDSVIHPSLIAVIKVDNIGFSRANNLGYDALPSPLGGMVIFLNPDTFLPPDYLGRAVDALRANPGAAIVSGLLLGFDPAAGKPTGRIDSAGIFRRWYGRWYDRGQGEVEKKHYDLIEAVPAVCGALLCCRVEALLPFRSEIFDPDFFLYKEDIELCLRLRNNGWTLIYDPHLVAYHCRGWKRRRSIPYSQKIAAAKSELLLYKKHPSPYIVWAFLKFLLVRFFRL
ncbi:MAG: glycosyltransferase family 2 protein [Desulforhopalus sp.]